MACSTYVRKPMERLTVHEASYKPLPIHCRSTPPVTLAKRYAGPWTAVTAHQDTYGIIDVRCATITKPPKDHAFLAGDGLDRFRDTVYGTDYSKRHGQRARPKTTAPRLPTKISFQTDTTTGCEYQRPEMQKLWRYAEMIPKKSSGQIQSVSVYRASYTSKPSKITDFAETKPMKTCIICNAAGSFKKDSRRATMPIDSLTTYMNHYKSENVKCRKIISSADQYCRFTTAPKAHNYD